MPRREEDLSFPECAGAEQMPSWLGTQLDPAIEGRLQSGHSPHPNETQ